MTDSPELRWTLAAATATPLLVAETVHAWGDTLVVAPHPDDESLGCGGVVALLRAAGRRVEIAVLTDGRHSHPHSREYPPERLIAVRREEVHRAARALGVESQCLHLLELEDAHTPPVESPAGQRAVARLREVVKRIQTVLVTWRDEPHCDHQAAYMYTVAAAAGLPVQILEYPVWLWRTGTAEQRPRLDEFTVLRIDIAAALARKSAAIAAHRSQVGGLVTDDPGGFSLPADLLAERTRPWELFLAARAPGHATRPRDSLDPAYFDGKYAEKLDYWDFATSPYEADKYAATLAALPRERYASGFEIGCSIGVLTARLAARCGQLLAVDVAASALAAADRACAGLPGVRLAQMQFPRERPADEARFDLVVVSEVGYYWSREALADGIAWLSAHTLPGGHAVLVHYTPFVSDYPLTGDEVHAAFLAAPGWRCVRSQRRPLYRLDVLERDAGANVDVVGARPAVGG